MINIKNLKPNLIKYINIELSKLASSNPVFNLTKPIIVRVVENQLDKNLGKLELLADAQGNIDIEGILDDMIENSINGKLFKIEVPSLGNLEIGEGCVKMQIPMTDKKLILDSSDLALLKETLTKNN